MRYYFIRFEMKLIISEPHIHESTNKEIEKLCDINDDKKRKIEYVKSLNENINIDKYKWDTCKLCSEYHISNEYPHYLKRKRDDKVMKFRYKNGYVLVDINKNPQLHHQVIATQFISNPNNYKEVDHLNQDGTDNHIENLEWKSRSDNNKNRASTLGVTYEFIDSLPSDSIEINEYKNNIFTGYYLSINEKKVYYFNSKRYKILHSRRNNNVHMQDINRKVHEFSINSLIKYFSD